MQKIIENMSAQPATCVIASVLLFFFAALENYILMDGLLEMHRSKSALKKLQKQYTFFQKIRLLHFKGNCRHAVKFCNGMIIYQKIGWLCFAVYLLAGLLYAFDFFPAAVISWLSIAIFFCFDLPSNQRIIAGNAQFTGIAAGRGVGFTTGLLLLREGLGMRETPIRPHSWH